MAFWPRRMSKPIPLPQEPQLTAAELFSAVMHLFGIGILLAALFASGAHSVVVLPA